MRASWRWIDVLSYLRTNSTLHPTHEDFPEDLEAPDDTRFPEQDLADISMRLTAISTGTSDILAFGGAPVVPDEVRGGDVALRFWKNLREGVKRENGGEVGLFDRVTVEWPMAMLLVRKV